jgi:hypothetical protein
MKCHDCGKLLIDDEIHCLDDCALYHLKRFLEIKRSDGNLASLIDKHLRDLQRKHRLWFPYQRTCRKCGYPLDLSVVQGREYE